MLKFKIDYNFESEYRIDCIFIVCLSNFVDILDILTIVYEFFKVKNELPMQKAVIFLLTYYRAFHAYVA